jgi:hypothetical protein
MILGSTPDRKNMKYVRRTLLSLSISALLLGLFAGSASATTAPTKTELLANWTGASVSSYAQWDNARINQAAWTSYKFDWSTDYCTYSPDQPLGFDFRMPCWRHDFGYRNYNALGQFLPNKSRLDDTFYFDLTTKCSTYSRWVRPSCNYLAYIYYQAVKLFGYPTVSQLSLDRATELKRQGLLHASLAGETVPS